MATEALPSLCTFASMAFILLWAILRPPLELREVALEEAEVFLDNNEELTDSSDGCD